jgi:hypothetical protein
MKIVTFPFAALLSAFVVGCASTPDPYDTKKPTYLVPFATSADAPAQVRYIVPDSPAQSAFEIGDDLLSVDDKPVSSTWGFYSLLSPTAKTIRVRARDGKERTVPVSRFIKPDSYEMWAWLLEPGQTLSFKLHNSAYAEEQDAALIYLKNSVAWVTASIWPTRPRYLEVYLELRVSPDCRDCKLENVAVLDQSRNSWLTPVSPDYVAWALYPVAGQEPRLMPVPPPTAVGYTGTTTTTGLLNAYSYGNYMSGTYSGTSLTTVKPYYDYTATNMAMAYNLGAMIRQSQIQTHGAARVSFVARRQSNLRIGDLNPGERITGFIHFQLPEGFDGPYLVAVKAGNIGIARFDAPRNQ